MMRDGTPEMMKTRPRRVGLALATLACVFYGLWTPRASAQSSPNEPKLVVKKRTVKVGRVLEGNRVKARFLIENHGNADLLIDRVSTSCGCTVPRKLTEDDKRVEPDESVEIVAEFNSTRRRGKQRKTITVLSNDPYEPRLQLFLEAEVVTLLDIQIKDRPARRLSFGSVRPGGAIADTVDILPTEPGQKFELGSLEVRNAAITFTTEPTHKDDRTGVRVRFRISPDAAIGQVITSLRITGTVGNRSVESGLPVNGDVTGVLTFSPMVLKQMQPVLPGNALRSVTVSSQTKTPFEILGVRTGPELEVGVKPAGRSAYTIEIHIADKAPPGPFGTFLDIHTSLVEQPLIRIPVFSSVRPLIEVLPPAVLLRVDGRRKSSRVVKLETRAGGALELTEIVADGPYVDAVEVTDGDARGQAVRHVRISVVGDPPPGTHPSRVRIVTGVVGRPAVTIPVTLLVKETS